MDCGTLMIRMCRPLTVVPPMKTSDLFAHASGCRALKHVYSRGHIMPKASMGLDRSIFPKHSQEYLH